MMMMKRPNAVAAAGSVAAVGGAPLRGSDAGCLPSISATPISCESAVAVVRRMSPAETCCCRVSPHAAAVAFYGVSSAAIGGVDVAAHPHAAAVDAVGRTMMPAAAAAAGVWQLSPLAVSNITVIIIIIIAGGGWRELLGGG